CGVRRLGTSYPLVDEFQPSRAPLLVLPLTPAPTPSTPTPLPPTFTGTWMGAYTWGRLARPGLPAETWLSPSRSMATGMWAGLWAGVGAGMAAFAPLVGGSAALGPLAGLWALGALADSSP